MLLGKRPRPPMKRTTSMTEFAVDLNTPGSADDADPGKPKVAVSSPGVRIEAAVAVAVAGGSSFPAAPRIGWTNSGETGHFLRACSLCKRRILPGRDIYMYRGDTAFCSSECRQQQMSIDEKREKSCLMAMKKKNLLITSLPIPSSMATATTAMAAAAATTEPSPNEETVAAA